MKKSIICPYCGEPIDSGALKCPICKTWLIDVTEKIVIPDQSVKQLKKKSFFRKYFWDEDVRNLFKFSTYCSAKDFWFGTLVLIILSFIPVSVCFLLIGTELLPPYSGIKWLILCSWDIFLFICFLSQSFRRLKSIGKSKWWILLYLLPFIGAIILFIWFSRTSPIKTVGSKFKLCDWIIISLVLSFFILSAMIYEEWMERERVRYSKSISKNAIEDSDKSIESNLEGTESESQIEEGNKEYANQLIEEAHSELIKYKNFREAAADAARQKMANIDSENSSYDDYKLVQQLNNIIKLNTSFIDDVFEEAREKYYEGKYSDAVRKAKFTKEKIKIFTSDIKEKLADCHISLDEYQQSNRTNEHQNSSNSSYQPEYGTRDVWVECMECHGSGKCRYCNGTGKNWYGNEYSTCVVCHGSTSCQICYGTRGHYEKQTYQIR